MVCFSALRLLQHELAIKVDSYPGKAAAGLQETHVC